VPIGEQTILAGMRRAVLAAYLALAFTGYAAAQNGEADQAPPRSP